MTPAQRRELAEDILGGVDSRLAPDLLRAFRSLREVALPPPRADQLIVLAGHRAAGKTAILPKVAKLSDRPPVDLDRALALEQGRDLRPWLETDPRSFRSAERAQFSRVAPGSVVAVGGGFLSLHSDLLDAHAVVLVPISFETYRERLLADSTRPRLRPELSPSEEIAQVFAEREVAHGRAATVSLVEFLRGQVASGVEEDRG